MQALITEMWMFLGGAFLIGMITTALLARIHVQSRLSRSDSNWGTRLRALEDNGNSRLRAVEQGYTEKLEAVEGEMNALNTDLQSQKARVSSLGDEVSKWRTDFQGLQAEHRELQENHDTTLGRLRTLDERLAVALEDADQLDLERKRLRGELERRGSELTKAMDEAAMIPALEAQIQEVERTVGEREARIRELDPLEDEVREVREQIDLMKREQETDLARREGEATRLRTRIGELEPLVARVDVLNAHLTEKKALLTSLESQVAALEGFPERLKDSERELGLAREQRRDAEAELARVRGELERLKRQPAPRLPDDLKRIHGIGPKLESRLHGLGYRTYKQIASWSQEDIDRVEHHLGEFPDRIRRDDWIGQAQRLQAEVNGDEATV